MAALYWPTVRESDGKPHRAFQWGGLTSAEAGEAQDWWQRDTFWRPSRLGQLAAIQAA
jgi:hypothetical protein